ncbi:MAG: YchF/TatD family DNA exonuclease [Verrucomicrobia bacterium]|nr:YchF/TatD family DNA exonuclease [Verrucomicrobiota bacterium]
MDLIDSHCHLQGFQKNGSLAEVLDRAAAAGVGQMIAVGTSPSDWVPYRELSASYPGRIHYTVGLHPCYVEADWENDLSQISPFFMPPHAPCALGEIGLDYFHLPKDPVAAGEAMLCQEAAFSEQLALARELNVPVIIHSRDAFDDTRRLIDASGIDWQRVVFHCCSYGPEEIHQINERGGRASFTGIVTYKNAESVRAALRSQGPEGLMLETDCPYLTPEPHRGSGNEPAFIEHIAQRCAEELGLEPAALATLTSANTRSFFGLK